MANLLLVNYFRIVTHLLQPYFESKIFCIAGWTNKLQSKYKATAEAVI